MEAARFPTATPLYEPQRMIVMFPAFVGNQSLACAISLEALTDHFGNSSKTPIQIFKQNRAHIERAASKLIAASRFEDDGSILIRTVDI